MSSPLAPCRNCCACSEALQFFCEACITRLCKALHSAEYHSGAAKVAGGHHLSNSVAGLRLRSAAPSSNPSSWSVAAQTACDTSILGASSVMQPRGQGCGHSCRSASTCEAVPPPAELQAGHA